MTTPDGDHGQCTEQGCDRAAAIRLHIPWDADRNVCLAHGRARAMTDGIVARPLSDTDDEWP